MQIIKKSGRKEKFSIEKIKKSLLAAANDADISITEAELKSITTELSHMIKDKDVMTSKQINIILSGLLYTNGFLNILEYYTHFKGKAENPGAQ